MRFKTLTIGLITGITVGCSVTNQNPTVQLTLEQPIPKSTSIPAPPDLPGTKSELIDTIQLAFFISNKPTNQFLEFSSNKLGSGKAGHFYIIEAKQETLRNTKSAHSKESIAQAAKLNSTQAQQLISINNKVKEHETKVLVVLPTYIPSGFRVNIFRVEYQHHPDPRFTGPRYEIVYRNSSNSCFIIGGGPVTPAGDAPIEYNTITEISSPAFGKVSLGYTDFDRYIGHGHLGFTESGYRIFKNENEYIFASPIEMFHPINCRMIGVQEAVKIVNSFQVLNP